MVSKVYFRTGGGISVPRHQTRGMKGCGAGAVLLKDGGSGSASSYDSVEQYVGTTGVNPYMRGRGLETSSALSGLKLLKTKKPKNISFSF
jgi:hypothetical protein